MTSRTKLWALSAGALALSLALAGCGGGGSSGSPAATNTGGGEAPPLATPAPMQVSLASVTMDGGNVGYVAPMATGDDPIDIDAGESETRGSVTFTCAPDGDDCTVMVAADGSVTSTGGTVTAANSMTYQTALDNEAKRVTALAKETALREKVAALQPIAGDADTDGSALMMAAKYAALIGTEKSDGDSLVAKNNAAMVLKAKSDLEDAIDAAKMARTEAMTAKDGLDASQTDLIGTLTAVIESANTAITEAQKILDATGTGSLASSVEMVTGGDEDNLKTADDTGMAVAEAVAEALVPTETAGDSTAANGAGLRVSHSNTAAPTDADATTAMSVGAAEVRAAGNQVSKANKYEAVSRHPDSKTWEMIVGDLVMDKAVNNVPTKVASWDSKMAAVDPTTNVAITTTDGDYTAVTTGIAVGYMGIPGMAYCLGTDCEVESNADGDKMLTGSWYFTPDSMTAHYKKAADETVYTADTMFATYGHWLVVDDSDDTSTTGVDEEGQVYVLTYAYAPAFDTTNADAIWGERSPGTPASEQATYTGMAAGRSVHMVSNTDVAITETHSGRFTANVELTAKFGASPMLEGMVSGFTSDNPDAVDSSWTVTLEETAVGAGTGAVTGGVATATGQDGTWSAASYGGAIDDAATTDVNEFRRPDGIYGSFNAHFTDGHVAGAYATRND